MVSRMTREGGGSFRISRRIVGVGDVIVIVTGLDRYLLGGVLL